MRRPQLRDQPQSQIQRLEHYAWLAQLLESGWTVETGEAAITTICNRARYALEELANRAREDHLQSELFTVELCEVIEAAIKVAESVVPDEDRDFCHVVSGPPGQLADGDEPMPLL